MFIVLVKSCFQLLIKPEKKSITLLAFFSTILGVLDFVAITLLGFLSIIFFSSSGKQQNRDGFAFSKFIDVDFARNHMTALALLCLFLLITKSLFSLILTLRLFKSLSDFQYNASKRSIKKVFSQDVNSLESRDVQEISYGMTTGIDSAITVILSSAITIIADTFLLVILVIPLFLVNFLMTSFLALYFFTLVTAIALFLTPAAHQTGEAESESLIFTNSILQRMIRGYREISIYGRLEDYLEVLFVHRRRSSSSFGKRLFLQQIPKFLFEFSLVLGILFFYIIQQSFSFSEEQLVASLVLYIGAAVRLAPSLLRIQTSILVIKSTAGLANQGINLIEHLDETSKIYSPLNQLNSEFSRKFSPSVEMRNLNFSYQKEKITLSSINLDIESFSRVAIVGKSGAGKSTLADLMLGLLSPDTGHVLISGMEVNDARDSWPRKFAYIPQKTTIFEGSFRENICLNSDTHMGDDDSIWNALEDADLLSFMKKNDYALSGRLGENGIKLSGGEEQRIAIARAIYSGAELVLMDEPTSALDKETEQAIMSGIKSLSNRCTLIVIAHNLRTVEDFDQIVYLKEGKVVGFGKFNDLRKYFPDFDQLAKDSGL